jgi:hypothetical protein
MSSPPVCLADAGTALMWAGAFHLFIGNAFIGAGEAILIIKLFKTRSAPTFLLVIAANYFSAWAGVFALGRFNQSGSSPSLYDLPAFLGAAFLITWLLTIFLEWPFIMPLFRGREKWLRASFMASLAAQTASYAVLTLYYLMFSYSGLLTGTHLDRNYAQWADHEAALFYIAQDGRAHRCKLDGSGSKRVSDIDLTGPHWRLFVRASEPGQSWGLYATEADPVQQDGKETLLLPHFAEIAALEPWRETNEFPTYNSRGDAIDFRPANARTWSVHAGFWAAEGMLLHNNKTGRSIRISLETPFAALQIKNVTVLPGDQIVFQLGDQICILDRQTMRLGMITRGKRPVVAYETKRPF